MLDDSELEVVVVVGLEHVVVVVVVVVYLFSYRYCGDFLKEGRHLEFYEFGGEKDALVCVTHKMLLAKMSAMESVVVVTSRGTAVPTPTSWSSPWSRTNDIGQAFDDPEPTHTHTLDHPRGRTSL